MQGNEANLKEALFKFKDIMDDHGIKFTLDKGTLLGAYRNGMLLPWDEDIDTEISMRSVDEFVEMDIFGLLRDAHINGFTQVAWGHEFKVDTNFIKDVSIASLPYDKQWSEFLKTDPRWTIERFGMVWTGSHESIELLKERDGSVHIDGFISIKGIHSSYSAKYNGKSLGKILLYGEEFYIPPDPEQYLAIIYGPTWRDIYCSTSLWFKYHSQISKGDIPKEVEEFNKKWILSKRIC